MEEDRDIEGNSSLWLKYLSYKNMALVKEKLSDWDSALAYYTQVHYHFSLKKLKKQQTPLIYPLHPCAGRQHGRP